MLVAEGANLGSNVLKVAHHGSRSSSLPQFLDRVGPAVAVISVGADNRFGHPHDETVHALESLLRKDRILLTKDRGDIEFVSDGRRLWVRTER